jgi:hypothetical protein
MRRSGRSQSSTKPAILVSGGACLRLLVSFLLLVWTIHSEAAVQVGPDLGKGQMRVAAAESITHPGILVREIASHLDAETSRFKTGAYVPVVEGNGKLVGTAQDIHLPLATASGTPFAIWHEAQPHLPPVRAFGARGPPPLAT